MSLEEVGDDEILYRRFQIGHYKTCQLTGNKVISSQAFSDKTRQVSVDRAKINQHNPDRTKFLVTDGVVELITREVRGISNISKNDGKGNPLQLQTLVVTPDPIKDDPELPDNPAHALISSTPDYNNRAVFNKVIEALALIAAVKIPPTNPLQPTVTTN